MNWASPNSHSLRRNRKPRPGTTGNSRRLSHSPSSSRFPSSLSSSPAEVVSPGLAVVPPTAITITTITTTIRAAASVNRSTRWIRSRAPTRTRNRKSRTIGRGTTARCWPATRRSHCKYWGGLEQTNGSSSHSTHNHFGVSLEIIFLSFRKSFERFFFQITVSQKGSIALNHLKYM